MADARQNAHEANWFALAVKPQHERAVAEQLAAYGLEAYVPLYRSRRNWSDRVKTIELPLFPCYVFSRFALENRLKVIRMGSVISIVGFGGIPTPISQEEIDFVRLLAGQGLLITPWAVLHMGERVRVREGPLCGVEGILVRERGSFRVVVNVEILNRAVALEIERSLLEPVGSSLRSSQRAGKALVLNSSDCELIESRRQGGIRAGLVRTREL